MKTETETVIKKILPYLVRRGYDVETDLDFETATQDPERYEKGYVDILVTLGRKRPQFLIEAKRAARKLIQKDTVQAIQYGRGQKVPFVVVTNGTEIRCVNTSTGSPILWDGKLIEKIPTKQQLTAVLRALRTDPEASLVGLGSDDTLPFRPGLPLKQLNALFARAHNRIRRVEKNEDHIFSDFSKLLFLKLLEEKADLGDDFDLPYTYRFHELAAKPASEADQVRDAVLAMIKLVKDRTPFGDVLEGELHFKNAATFQYLVKQLSSVSFHDSRLDAKGAAFEYYVRATLKGKRLGQYFTPRPLVELMLTVIGRDKILNSLMAGTTTKVLDPACGTGGFLVFLMQENLRLLDQLYSTKKITKAARDVIAKRIMEDTFFGSDANDGVAAAAKMNMIISGDGHSNIRAEDSLAAAATSWSVVEPDCDIILTNPPFGTSEADSLTSKDLAQYPVRSTKGQLLFLQKMVLSTKPDGEICTVIDDGVLNTDSAAEVRRWLLIQCELLGVIKLPDETFKPNKINVRSSVLYLRRRPHPDVDLELDHPITFCKIDSLGYLGSGDPVRGFDYSAVLSSIAADLFDHSKAERQGPSWYAYDVSAQDVIKDGTNRFDFKYWLPDIRRKVTKLKAAGAPTIAALNRLETTRGRSPLASSYVDQADGYALVVKAGSNISKYGQLVVRGDFVEKDIFDEMTDYHLADGDILLASTGDGTLGKCCVYRSDLPGIPDGHVTAIRVDPQVVNPEYLADYLRCGFGAAQIERLYTGSTGLIELTPGQVDTIVVDLLSGVKEQQTLSKALRSSERSHAKTLAETAESLEVARREFQERTATTVGHITGR